MIQVNRILRPVIGVLVQPAEWYDQNGIKEDYLSELKSKSHLYTQYARYLEAAGALVYSIYS
jgi:hypothetical protein